MQSLLALGAAVAIAAAAGGARTADATITLPEYAKQGELWKSIEAQNQLLFKVPAASELWFTQRVDHFATDESSAAAASNTTFQQRYYEVNTFWRKPDGPVILYIGGEGALTNAPAGFVHVLAQRFGAKILALEHRFYGESIPNGNLETDNYRFLTVEQALADLKHFREAYQQSMYPSTANKWIAIGGSYPGALAAWFRVAYPDTTVASLSSSGVVDPVYAFDAFDEHVALAAGPTCANALRKTTAAFEAEIARGNATRVKALLGAQDLSDADFHYMIADSAAMAVQYGHKNVLCDHMVRAYDAQEPLPEAFANFTITMYGPDFGRGCFYNTACLVNDRSRWADVRSWRWQKCAQLAYFQVAPKSQSLRSSIVDLHYHEQQCRAVFGDAIDTRAGVAAIKQRYGGAKPRGHKIFFSNGGDDPWQRASVLTSLSDDEVANLAQCDLCGHCGDLRADPDSPAPLKKQRDEILKYLTKWLAESDAAAPVVPSSVQSDAALLPGAVAGTPGAESESSYRTSPFVLVPIVVAFVAFVGVLHKDFVRDSRSSSRAGYERLTGV